MVGAINKAVGYSNFPLDTFLSLLVVAFSIMYWTDWGANPKIERAAMDGSARQVIVTGNITWPNGLTIDKATNRLFWVDANLDKLEVSDLSGGNRQLIMSSTANIHPYGLAMYQNMLYWTDWNTKSVSRFNLSSGHQQIIVTGLQKPMDIHVFDSSLRFSGTKFISFNTNASVMNCYRPLSTHRKSPSQMD